MNSVGRSNESAARNWAGDVCARASFTFGNAGNNCREDGADHVINPSKGAISSEHRALVAERGSVEVNIDVVADIDADADVGSTGDGGGRSASSDSSDRFTC